MTDLSPTAQAVFNAAWTCPIALGDHPATRRRQLAAALRAAADRVYHHWDGADCVDYLCAIATELEACCEWLQQNCGRWEIPMSLRAARRPKPPSLKEQALALIDACNDPDNDYLDDTALDTIRRALEALPND